ncbi:MAG: 5-formyltetrahydrofolate cyclo-ligase [Bacillota bacterium]|nr:5-formyltetrahydrofolate cyclo-ligase [Bacillota bacterium]
MENKKVIRGQMKDTLSKLSKDQYKDNSKRIANQLYEDTAWKEAKTIGITISKPPEVATQQIIKKAWEQGKKVAVPKCYPKEKKMVFRQITEFSQLESVFYGLIEPKEEQTAVVEPEQIDLMMVPGLAYTLDGYRVGFGGGYYDRYLKNFHGNTLSLAFDCQIISYLDAESHDIPVSKIITNHGVYETK